MVLTNSRPIAAVLAVFWMAYLYRGSSFPPEVVAARLPGPTGNWMHIAAHVILAGLLLRAFTPWNEPGRSPPFAIGFWPGLATRVGALVLILTSLHGLFDEVHQHFVPGRTCSVIDLGLDAAGAVLVLLFPIAGAPGRPLRVWPFLAVLAGALLLGWIGSISRPWPDRVLEEFLGSFTQTGG